MWRLLGTCVAGALAAVAIAQPPAAMPQLAAQLGADSFAEREAAMAALLEAGPAAIPALEAAAASANPEAARRAALLLARIRRRADAALLVPKPVPLDYRNVPLAAAVADLKARTGINLVLDAERIADPQRLITCIADELPPWEALAAFCRAAGVCEALLPELPIPDSGRTYLPPPPEADEVPVALIDGQHDELPAVRSSAVRVQVLPPRFPGHRVYLGSGRTTLCFDVAPVPSVFWQGSPEVRIARVIDDAGRSGGAGLLPPQVRPEPFDPDSFRRANRGDGPERRTTNPNPRVVPVSLRLATPAAKRLRVLEGAVVGEVLVPGQTLATFARPLHAIGQPVNGAGGVKATLLEVTAANGLLRVRVRLESGSPWLSRSPHAVSPLLPEVPRGEGLTRRIAAFDADGRPLPPTASDLVDVQDDGERLATVSLFQFRGGAPATLLLVGPRTAAVEVPFRFEGVPLP